MELTTGPVSWPNQAHNFVSLILCADMVLAQSCCPPLQVMAPGGQRRTDGRGTSRLPAAQQQAGPR